MNTSISEIFSGYSGKEDELIPLLQKVQQKNGYLSESAMTAISKFLRIPLSKVYGVATFYAQFRFKSKGENHIMLCRGTACHVQGAPGILNDIETHLGIKEGETTADMQHSLESVACIGACSLAPCIMINDKVEAKLTSQKVKVLFSKSK